MSADLAQLVTSIAQRARAASLVLATTPTETLQQAAAENYDDILYNQQL